ncbi:MAG: CHAD domain-containing protein [Myxococcales bacterium]
MARGKQPKEHRAPSEPGRLTLDERLPLRLGLGAAFAGVVGYARAMVDAAADDPVDAVHEYRKALRRARAVVRLARPVLGGESFRALVHDLRDALRGTSPLRDAAVLLKTLAGLPDDPASRPARHALARLLQAESEAGVAAAPQKELRRSLQILSPIPERLLACLPEKVRWRELRAGLERSYRRTRRARERAFRTREDTEVHAFRKSVKELRYQVELLQAAGGEKPGKARRKLAGLAEALGEVTDLTLLRRTAHLRLQELAGTRPEALFAVLDEAIEARLEALEKSSRPLFERSCRDFAERATRSFH